MRRREALLPRQLAQLLVQCLRQLLTERMDSCASLDPLQPLVELTPCDSQILELDGPPVQRRLLSAQLRREARVLRGDAPCDVDLPRKGRCRD